MSETKTFCPLGQDSTLQLDIIKLLHQTQMEVGYLDSIFLHPNPCFWLISRGRETKKFMKLTKKNLLLS